MNKLEKVSIEAEYKLILETLQECNFSKTKAAKELGIDRKTLYFKIDKYKALKKE